MFDDFAPHRPDLSELRGWIGAWYDEAVKAGYIQPPYALDGATTERLHGYFDVGLTAEDAVHAVFGVLH